MTIKSDKELQDFINSQDKNYYDEEVQKSTIIAHDVGASITLYDWIHRNDEPLIECAPPDWQALNDAWVEEFRRLMLEG